MCDSVNHTHFPKEDHLPDWVCWDKQGNKGDRVHSVTQEDNIATCRARGFVLAMKMFAWNSL